MAKTKVAILGGGLSGLVTALGLTAPEQNDQYDITIYQLGWRLGGKCATGRNPDFHQRIQEHGLHVFMGQYDNAFAMVQALYAEAARPPFPDWRKAYTQVPAMSLMEEVDGTWIPWVIEAPVFPGTPGIDPPPSIFKRMFQFLGWIMKQLEGPHAEHFAGPADGAAPWWRRALHWLLALIGRGVEHAAIALLRDAMALVDRLDPDPVTHTKAQHNALADLLHELRVVINRTIGHLVAGNTELRRLWIVIDLGVSSLIGGLRDGLLLDPAANIDAVNRRDYKQWLMAHGADAMTANSALVRALYDLIFAYPEGDWQGSGDCEAGTMFLSLMNTATYQGSIIWKFNTATGDLVIEPLYQVLKARGVKFEWFSRIDELTPSPAGDAITSVTIGRQVELANGAYDPLYPLASGQLVWPDRPLYDQIKGGAALKASGADLESKWTTWPDALPPRVLQAGADYDLLVLAIPPGAHRDICAGLIAQKSAWQGYIAAVQTVATQSLQTWTTVDEKDMGWDHPAMVGGFDASNLNSWADISEVLATEEWPHAMGVKGEQIFCGPLPCPPYPPPKSDTAYPQQAQAMADQSIHEFIDGKAADFWPARFGKGGPKAGTLAATYSRVNIDPGERYTLSVTGSSQARLRTDGSGYVNLYLTGDWIQNGQNLGSFEATTVSGMLASRAISGFPNTIIRLDAARFSIVRKAAGTLPRYVDYAGQVTFPGEIELGQTRMWAFLLKGDQAKMAAWCEAMFDTPSHSAVQVLPLSSYLMMSVVDIGVGRFADAPQMGWSRERELTFWIPVVRVADQDGMKVASKFYMAMPYLVLDNPVAIASGREIFGYMKQAGRIACPGDPGNPSNLAVDLFATKTFGPDSEEQYQRLLDLTPTGGSHPLDEAVRGFEGGAKALWSRLTGDAQTWYPSLKLGEDLLGDVLGRRIPQLFLKQFRDVADGTRACYQAITEAPGHVARFDSIPQLAEYDMVLHALDSSPIAAQLGIAPQQRVRGAEFVYDMTIAPGTVLWQA
ncbi:NAD(P)-binding protein [Novosphingobium sp.]|uniref:NAD(P)-binding protein n=1 Tax=Novosphingobium sp. TaxID=1874826 RepID=UPI00286C6395|nr:NAD(P)-binding protein [Novosphingobium sp.]